MICPNCRSDNDDTATTCFTCGTVLRGTISIRKGSVVAGRYEILETLGKGGMGMVYKAHDRTLDEEVALKLLRADIAADPDMASRFRREIKLARKVRHKNVCGIHEYGEDGPLRFIAMEFIAGVDMRQILKQRGAPPADEAFEIAIQVGEGLQAIHDAGIIHRDLKTPNIMRDAKGVVRLMDFGIAKQAGTEATLGATAIGMIVGTPEYMSPEQARGEKVDFRSDIYALGIVAFEVFTGNVPFRGETPIATIFKHLQEPPPLEGLPAAGIPASAVPVLRKALAKTADERYATAVEMAEALKRARAEFLSRPAPTAAPTETAGAVALESRPQPLPAHGMPTPVPTKVPTSVRTAVGPAAAQVSEARSHTAIERERKGRDRIQALKAACDGMDAALGRGAVEEAAAVLAQAQADLGDTDPLPAFAARIEVARRQAAVQQLLGQAEARLTARSFDEAQQLAQQAQQQDPSNARVRSLLDGIATARERLAEDARRRADEEERRQAEESRQRKEAARRAAEEERKRADEERRRAEDERRKVEEQRRQEAARRAADEERKRADQERRRAEDEKRRAEEERRGAEERQRAEDARRKAGAIASSAAGVEALMAAGDFDGASRALTEAQRAHGKVEPLTALPSRIEAARREAQQAAIRQLLDRAETLAAAQRFGEAIQALQEALRQEPGQVQAKKRLATLEEERKGQELARAVAALELLVSRGHLEQAKSELQAAEKTYGKIEALKRLRKSLQEIEKKQAAATAAPRPALEVRPAEPTRPAAQPVRPAAELTRPVAEPPRPAAKPAGPARSVGMYVALGVVAVALVAGGVAWQRSHNGDTTPDAVPSVEPEPGPSADAGGTPSSLPSPSPVPPPSLAPASGSGLLIVDALPWGEVTEVLDSKGKRQSLGESPFTPLVLSLAPGDYKITIKNPGSAKPATLTATIKGAGVERKTAEFRRIDADEYLKKAGF
jgi:hypothetical protein